MEMKFNPVGWFEIPVSDIDRAKRFYEQTFSLDLKREDFMGYEMVWFPMTTPTDGKPVFGITGALMKGEGYTPGAKGPVIYFTAPDFKGTIDRAIKAGGTLVLPEKAIGKFGFIAWLKDSEGNIVALHRMA